MAAPTALKTCRVNNFSIVLVVAIIDFFQLTLIPSRLHLWVHQQRPWTPSELKSQSNYGSLGMGIKIVLRLGKHQHPSYLSLFLWSQHEKIRYFLFCQRSTRRKHQGDFGLEIDLKLGVPLLACHWLLYTDVLVNFCKIFQNYFQSYLAIYQAVFLAKLYSSVRSKLQQKTLKNSYTF